MEVILQIVKFIHDNLILVLGGLSVFLILLIHPITRPIILFILPLGVKADDLAFIIFVVIIWFVLGGGLESLLDYIISERPERKK